MITLNFPAPELPCSDGGKFKLQKTFNGVLYLFSIYITLDPPSHLEYLNVKQSQICYSMASSTFKKKITVHYVPRI